MRLLERLAPARSVLAQVSAYVILAAIGPLAPRALAEPVQELGQEVNRVPSVKVPPSPMAAGRRAIVIDGDLNEPAWDTAARIGPLTQTVPIEGAPMSVETDILLTYDEENVYIGLRCYDDPSEVRARQMERDAFVRYDDVVEFWFDPLDSGRFGYWFQVTPAGSLGDALLADNGSSFNKDWDGIWYGDVSLNDDGWYAEIRIPIKTMSFNPAAAGWGFNIRRKRVANGEEGRWASPRIGYQFFQISDGGRLTGIAGLNQGLGLDVRPYVKFSSDRASTERAFGSAWDTGATIRWRPSPATTLLVTTNTDFAETEVDARQINLGRFPLFFPEKRDFFLEDAGVFEFGAPANRSSLRPFFSRRIGRDADGEPIPLLAGVKFTGRVGDWTLGALNTYIDETDRVDLMGSGSGTGTVEEVGRQNLGVLRASRAFGDGQAIGAILTTGDPGGDSGRITGGVDARFGSSDLLGAGHSGFLWAYALGTVGADDGENAGAYGMQTRTQSSFWSSDLRIRRVDRGFAPALGFVRRTAVDTYDASVSRTWRSEDQSSLFRTTEAGLGANLEFDLDGNEDSWRIPIDIFEGQFWSQDSFGLRVTRRAETIDEPFNVGSSATVVPGDYQETRGVLFAETNDRRLFGLEARYELGDYFGGTIEEMRIEPIYLPNKFLTMGGSFRDVEIDLGGDGTLHTQLYSLRFDVLFDAMTAWKSFIQYDTDSKNLSAQTRVRWILEPGRELFIVGLFGFSKEDTRSAFTSEAQSLAVKFEATFRF
ncbi:MAG: hypothetical protein ACJA2W_001772 [Planctomycetota bacterium]|jgi:hypothetical protein